MGANLEDRHAPTPRVTASQSDRVRGLAMRRRLTRSSPFSAEHPGTLWSSWTGTLLLQHEAVLVASSGCTNRNDPDCVFDASVSRRRPFAVEPTPRWSGGRTRTAVLPGGPLTPGLLP